MRPGSSREAVRAGADSRRPSGLRDPCEGLGFDRKRSGRSLQFEWSREMLGLRAPRIALVCTSRSAGCRGRGGEPPGSRRGDPGRRPRSAQCSWRELAGPDRSVKVGARRVS